MKSIISMDSAIGYGCEIEVDACLSSSVLGRSVYLGNRSRLFKTEVGNYTSIGPNVTIGENEHHTSYISTSNFLLNAKMRQLYFNNNKATTSIGGDVWIGVGATIKKGVKIGSGAIVGANALVTKNVPPYCIVGGVPAKVLKYRFNQNNIDKLLQSKWWELEDHLLKKIFSEIEFLDEDDMCEVFTDKLHSHKMKIKSDVE